MPLWLTIIIGIVQLCVGGMAAFGFVFWMSAERAPSLNKRHNDTVFRMLFSFCFALFASLAAQVFFYLQQDLAAYVSAIALPWLIFVGMVIYFKKHAMDSKVDRIGE
ncbi:hypothetical protein INR79_10595 [Vibrio sp. SCSIO 43132]|uniref:hypothetical protein n=1 Tax=Vibrio sp. SCSIO 43132 TaxID=2779363 RepID=UPI001CA956FD|nr:hypothetical protein [Vibrio sp. SCSIO 43132]UAB68985.1 hypothetical protein INR79_10595 [Vibrio sp. SCSIO 43132]